MQHCKSVTLQLKNKFSRPSEQDPDPPTDSPSHQEASTNLLSLPIRGQTGWNHGYRKPAKLVTCITVLSDSVKLWAMTCGATQDGRVLVHSPDKTLIYRRKEWQTSSVFLSWEPYEQSEKAKRYDTKGELPRSVGAQYATGEGWRNNSRENEKAEPKWKQHPIVEVPGDKVWCCKE